MKSDQLREYRTYFNQKLIEADSFFKEFGQLDHKAYADGAIDKKHKELMGLAISIVTRCNECILFHLEGSIKAEATLEEIIEAIKIGVIGGGSITYPNARFAFEMIEELINKH